MARKPGRLPEGTRISDHVTLGVLTATVPASLIDAVLADTGRQSQRQRQLPARMVVCRVDQPLLAFTLTDPDVQLSRIRLLVWVTGGGTPVPATAWDREASAQCPIPPRRVAISPHVGPFPPPPRYLRRFPRYYEPIRLPARHSRSLRFRLATYPRPGHDSPSGPSWISQVPAATFRA
jgi:hypothetical protein